MIAAADITARIKRLPVFPEAPARLASLLSEGRCGVDDFERVVKPDPGLTANILRLANSAYFGLSRRIGSARDAIAILGLKRVYDVATMAAVQHVLPARLAGYEMSARGLWQHCVSVAVLAEQLARQSGEPPPALVFTAGLMHDVGKLVLGEFLAEHAAPVLDKLRSEQTCLVNAEREVLGLDHSEVGFAIAQAWHLPETVAAVARHHHHPDGVADESARWCVDLVHVGDALAHALGLGADVGELHRPVAEAALDRLGLTPAALEQVAGRALAEIEALTGLEAPEPKGERP